MINALKFLALSAALLLFALCCPAQVPPLPTTNTVTKPNIFTISTSSPKATAQKRTANAVMLKSPKPSKPVLRTLQFSESLAVEPAPAPLVANANVNIQNCSATIARNGSGYMLPYGDPFGHPMLLMWTNVAETRSQPLALWDTYGVPVVSTCAMLGDKFIIAAALPSLETQRFISVRELRTSDWTQSGSDFVFGSGWNTIPAVSPVPGGGLVIVSQNQTGDVHQVEWDIAYRRPDATWQTQRTNVFVYVPAGLPATPRLVQFNGEVWCFWTMDSSGTVGRMRLKASADLQSIAVLDADAAFIPRGSGLLEAGGEYPLVGVEAKGNEYVALCYQSTQSSYSPCGTTRPMLVSPIVIARVYPDSRKEFVTLLPYNSWHVTFPMNTDWPQLDGQYFCVEVTNACNSILRRGLISNGQTVTADFNGRMVSTGPDGMLANQTNDTQIVLTKIPFRSVLTATKVGNQLRLDWNDPGPQDQLLVSSNLTIWTGDGKLVKPGVLMSATAPRQFYKLRQ